MATDFRKVRISRITFGRPRSSAQNYLRAGAAPDLLLFKPNWRRMVHGATMWRFGVEWWSQIWNPLSFDVGLAIFIFVWKSCGSSQIKLNQFLLQWICNEPLIITGVSDLHENGLRIQFTTKCDNMRFRASQYFFLLHELGHQMLSNRAETSFPGCRMSWRLSWNSQISIKMI